MVFSFHLFKICTKNIYIYIQIDIKIWRLLILWIVVMKIHLKYIEWKAFLELFGVEVTTKKNWIEENGKSIIDESVVKISSLWFIYSSLSFQNFYRSLLSNNFIVGSLLFKYSIKFKYCGVHLIPWFELAITVTYFYIFIFL